MRKVKLLLVLSLVMCLVGCGISTDTVTQYAQTFCQTTSDRMWKQNKSFLLKHCSEDIKEDITRWFQGSNYSDNLTVRVRDLTIAETGKTVKALGLLECSNSNVQYSVILNLNFEDGKLVSFNYRSVEGMEQTN